MGAFTGEHRWGSKDRAAWGRRAPGTHPIGRASPRGFGGGRHRGIAPDGPELRPKNMRQSGVPCYPISAH